MMIHNFLVVALGGAIGASARYGINLIKPISTFPWQTFVINAFGCFIIGICISLFKNNKIDNLTYLLLATGVCGGFTTFSTFSAESLSLLQNDKFLHFGLYVIASVVLGLIATYLGYKIIK
jgi:fluoride exporter